MILSEFIENGLNSPYNYKLTYKDIGNKLDNYISVIKEYCVELELEEDECELYFYRPKYLSNRLYGTTDLWYLLMKLNNINDKLEFTKDKLFIVHPQNISIINKIFVKEGMVI